VLKVEFYTVLAKLLGSDYQFKTQIMETFNSEKLSSYQIDHQKLVTGLRPIQMPKVTQQNLAER